MKLWEKVNEGQLRKDILISQNQFHFMPSRSTIEVIHLIGRLIELYKDKKNDLHLVFMDLEKAYDKVPRVVMWECLKKKGCRRRISKLLTICARGGGED